MEHHYYRWVGEKHTHVEGGNIGVQVPGIHIDPRGFIEMVEPQSIMNYGKVEEGKASLPSHCDYVVTIICVVYPPTLNI